MSSKPEDPIEFAAWSTAATCGLFTSTTDTWFSTSQNNLLVTIQAAPFFASLSEHLRTIAEQYKADTGSALFALGRNLDVQWHKKSFDSFRNKLFRINCLENTAFPEAPEKGWTSLDQSFEVIDDIIRTTVVVAYADGPEYLGKKLTDLAHAEGILCSHRDHAKEKGYYAFHLYPTISVPVALTSASASYKDRTVQIEIQITTELQGALREITHVLYEKERLEGLEGDWKKQFGSGRFRAAYMAHSLRFIEAMIVELRNKSLIK